MKLAWIVASGPPAQVQAAVERLEIIADTYLSPSTPVQLAAGKFLALRGGMQSQIKERVAENLAFLDGKLREFHSLARLQREGGWYAVLRVPVSGSDEALAVELMERCSVLVHPGNFFNFAQEGFLVISLIAPAADFREGIRRIGGFFDKRRLRAAAWPILPCLKRHLSGAILSDVGFVGRPGALPHGFRSIRIGLRIRMRRFAPLVLLLIPLTAIRQDTPATRRLAPFSG